jgi:hypothetical protein
MASTGDGGPPRLSPSMSSRRLQVLGFIRDYIAAQNESPSLGEIASGCGIDRSKAHRHVRSLIRQGHLMRRRGMRGLMLPSAIEEAKRQLREAGYRIDEDFGGDTKSRLLPLPPLDYLPRQQGGEGDDGDDGKQRGERDRRLGRASSGKGG